MGQINLKISDELEKEFRKIAVKKFGAKKGFLKKALEDAIQLWIKNNRGKVKSE